MKRQNVFSFTIILMLLLILSGCGGGGSGAPGSSGSDNTGVMLETEVRPYYIIGGWTISNTETASTISLTGNFTNAVDVTQADCDPLPDVIEFEPMAAHSAVLVINAKLLNPSSTFKPGNLFITEYKVDYFRSTDSLTAPPIESDRRFVSITVETPSGSGNWYSASSVVLVDLIRKDRYVEMINSGMYTSRSGFLNNYTAEYTFYGQDNNAKSFSFKARVDFTMGAYDNCGLRQ